MLCPIVILPEEVIGLPLILNPPLVALLNPTLVTVPVLEVKSLSLIRLRLLIKEINIYS